MKSGTDERIIRALSEAIIRKAENSMRFIRNNGKRILRIVTALLWTALALWLAASAAGLYREGTALREAGDVLAPIYTEEAVAKRLAAAAPLFAAAMLATAAGLVFGAGKEKPAGKAPKADGDPCPPTARHRTAVRAVLLILAAAMIIAGILNGSMKDVLVKAVNLCTECVGLG